MSTRGHIYIIGKHSTQSERAELEMISGILRNEGYQVILPHDLFDGLDLGILTRKEQMAIRIRELVNCSQVLNMDNFYDDQDCQVEMNLARSIGMNYESVFNFLNKHGIKIASLKTEGGSV